MYASVCNFGAVWDANVRNALTFLVCLCGCARKMLIDVWQMHIEGPFKVLYDDGGLGSQTRGLRGQLVVLGILRWLCSMFVVATGHK